MYKQKNTEKNENKVNLIQTAITQECCEQY